jgi:hypothetical protein
VTIDSSSYVEIPGIEITPEEPKPTVEETPEPIVEAAVEIEQSKSIENTETTSTETKYQSIARYRIERNANFHAADLTKKGQNVQVERNGIWYEVKIVQ